MMTDSHSERGRVSVPDTTVTQTQGKDVWIRQVQKRLALFVKSPDDSLTRRRRVAETGAVQSVKETGDQEAVRRELVYSDESEEWEEPNEQREAVANHHTDEHSSVQRTGHGAKQNDMMGKHVLNVGRYVGDQAMAEALCQAGVPMTLYPWQAECLSSDGLLDAGRNVVYCAPTSGGKSMVAEVLMLRRMIKTGKPALLVLPFVSICAEKSARYKRIFDKMPMENKRVVVEFYGSLHTSMDVPTNAGIIVSTIEKANILVNQWMEEDCVERRLSAVCVDELHMIGDADRGYLLELMLTKLLFVSRRRASLVNPIQIIGMSATIRNVDEVASWLDAVLYQTDYRPVPLNEYFVKGNKVTDSHGRFVRSLPGLDGSSSELGALCALVKESVSLGHSVIIFCCSRKSCETTANLLARKLHFIPEQSGCTQPGESFSDGETFDLLDGEIPSRQIISEAIEIHHNSPGLKKDGEDKSALQMSIEKGISWHHAGLDSEEREIVEKGFKSGTVSVLCATSTLAAGVNLPARRVIFRHPYVGKPGNLLTPSKYRQMAGRAGRAGLDTLGEAFLLSVNNVSDTKLYELMNQDIEPISSCLDHRKKGMHRAMLEVIASRRVSTPQEVDGYVRATLLARMMPYNDVVSYTKSALRWLGDPQRRYIVWDPNESIYAPTNVGIAVHSSGMPPEICEDIVDDLTRAREALVLASDLHLTYICVPINEDVAVDWGRLLEIMNTLSPINLSVSEKVGVNRGFLRAKARGYSSVQSADTTWDVKSDQNCQERILKRFWIALILSDILQEAPFATINSKYGIQRGLAQGIQDRASRHAGMLATFCSRSGWNDLEILIRQFQSRVLHGVLPEMLQLMEVPRVKAYSARMLFKGGIKTPEMLAAADPLHVESILSSAYKKTTPTKKKTLSIHAKRLVSEAQYLLVRRAEALRQQVQHVMEAYQ